MIPGARNSITDVPGLRGVGHASDPRLKSGVTVLAGEAPMVAGVCVMGGAPGTRETDLLAPDATVAGVDALVLAGGSAFGLAAADGVADALRAEGKGFLAAGHPVPIVPAAILFDLANGGDKDWETSPYAGLGRAAYADIGPTGACGSIGAGTGATTADLKGGLGTASLVLASGVTVGALVAVNALGSVCVDGGPEFWAAPFEIGDEFGGRGPAAGLAGPPVTKLGSPMNTTIAIVATDAELDKAGATRMAVAAHDGLARAIVPAHTPMDGDLVFAAATGQRPAGAADPLLLGHYAAICLARAVARAVFHAVPAPGDPVPCWQEKFAATSA